MSSSLHELSSNIIEYVRLSVWIRLDKYNITTYCYIMIANCIPPNPDTLRKESARLRVGAEMRAPIGFSKVLNDVTDGHVARPAPHLSL